VNDYNDLAQKVPVYLADKRVSDYKGLAIQLPVEARYHTLKADRAPAKGHGRSRSTVILAKHILPIF
jgi:hypothetical protein